LFAVADIQAAQKTWNNTGTDWNTATDWTGGVPTGNNVAVFATSPGTQPNVSTSDTTAGVYFLGAGTAGFNLTSSNSAVTLTLTGTGSTGNGGTSNSSAAAIRSEATSGTNTVSAPLILGAAAGATQVFYQETGGTLVVSGPVSSTNAVTLSFKGSGTIELDGTNTFTNASRIADAGTTLLIGNNSALGTSTFTVAATSTIAAAGGARTIGNDVVLAGTATIGGSNALTINGSVTAAGAATRTLTVNNSALTTLGGPVFLSDVSGTGRTLAINGTGNVTVNGVISNFNGSGTAGTLSHGGSGILTLNSANTYTGGTLMSGGTTVATANGAFGTGNVSLTAANVTLTLQGTANPNFIADTANLSIFDMTNTVNLNYTGTETVQSLIVQGAAQAPGVYGAGDLPELFGTGTITVLVPEPATFMLMGVGLLLGAQRLRRKR